MKMEYKKIIKNRKTREHILNLLRFIPDSLMLKIQYKIKLNRNLNLKHPERFTEKLQWYKIHYRNPIMHKCVDKYSVRDYVKSKGLEDILVPLIGHFNNVHDIDWDKLPNEFVVKTTNGGGGLNTFICMDKSKSSRDAMLAAFDTDCAKPIKTNTGGREWAYYRVPYGIVVEQLLKNKENPKAGVNDYKIFCYNGQPKYIIVDVDRYIGHKRNFYDLEWNNLHVESDCKKSDKKIPKPKNFTKMLEIAHELSQDFPYVRVDLYNIDGHIYFGELTFYPWSGYVQFSPDEWDFEFGKDFLIDNIQKNGVKND